MLLTKLKKHRTICTKRKNLSAADMSTPSSTPKKLHLSHFEHNHVPLVIEFASLAHDNHIKGVKYIVRPETVLLPQEDNCQSIL